MSMSISTSPRRRRIVVAMSGGVDSSAAAALLAEAGAEVVGVTLKLYDAAGTTASVGGRCCTPRDIDDARAVAARYGFAHYVLDESQAFSEAVIDDFVSAHAEGRTPNPCVRCNEKMKFGPLVRFARAIGAEALATGHYARLETLGDEVRLRRAVDRDKDQAYFLFAVPPAVLPFVRFPLGEMTKDQVRAEGRRLGLPNWDKADSQQICFIPDGDHKAFVAARGGAGRPGEIIDEAGQVMGEHQGTHHFTVGQRKGLPAVGGAEKRFVLRVDAASGQVHVGPRSLLGRRQLRVTDMRWLRPHLGRQLRCQVQIRHHSQAHAASVEVLDGGGGESAVLLDDPAFGVAPGQAAVFFQDDEVLGGGWIAPLP